MQLILLAHNIRSAYNVGSIFRSAECFGVTKLYLTGYTPYPASIDDSRPPHVRDKLDKQIAKTALGAERLVAYAGGLQPESTVADYRAQGFTIAALEQTPASLPLAGYRPPQKLLLILGEEVHGIPPELVAHCDLALEIPLLGTKESLNVSVATGIALYALRASARI